MSADAQKAEARPPPRLVPGAPSLASGSSSAGAAPVKAKKRNKRTISPASVPLEDPNSVKVQDPKQAATVAAIPDPSKQVTGDKLKVQPGEQAEGEGKNAGSTDDGNGFQGIQRSAVHSLITKRLKVISKKLQRVITYEAQPKDSLNDDQRRIIDSKSSLLAVQTELQEILGGLYAAEKEDAKAVEAEIKEKLDRAKQTASKESSEQIVTLLQFLHLFALFNPQLLSNVDSFAPPPLPAALQESVTGQEVAALGKIFEQLALGPLEASTAARVAGQEDGALDIIAKLRNVHEEGEVLQGVGYTRVHEMIHQLTLPAAEPASHIAPAFGNELPDADADAVSEIEQTEVTEQESPSTLSRPAASGLTFGTVDDDILSSAAQKAGVPHTFAPTGTSQFESPEEKFESPEEAQLQPNASADHPEGVKGGGPDAHEQSDVVEVPGPDETTNDAQDGFTQASAAEPVAAEEFPPTSEEPQNVGAESGDLSMNAPINWADEMEQISAAPQAGGATSVAAEKEDNIQAAPTQKEVERPKDSKPRTNLETNAPKAKPQPQVDEEGFTLMASKKFLQQQERGRARGKGRGGSNRGGANANGRGGASGPGRQRREGSGSESPRPETQSRQSARGRSVNSGARGQAGKSGGKPRPQKAEENPAANE